MIDLLIYELRRIAKSPLPYIMVLFLTMAMILAWWRLDSDVSRKLRAENDPIVQMENRQSQDTELQNFKVALEKISTSETMKMRYRNEINLIEDSYKESLTAQIKNRYLFDPSGFGVTPQNEAEFNELVKLLAVADEENAKNRNVPYIENANDFTGFTYRLFQFTQSGFLILCALVLGLTFSGVQRGPVFRKVGTSGLLLARVLALTLTGCLVLLVPRLIASFLVLEFKGSGYLGLLLPFNPKAGLAVYQVDRLEVSVIFSNLLPFKTVSATSLTTLATAFFSMYLYEVAQIFVWVSIGLLAGGMTRRKFLSFAIPSVSFLFFKISYPALSRFGAAGFLFPIYHDAIRDVIGNPFRIMIGLVYRESPAQDYFLALFVMLLTGLFALYLADLFEKRRLFQSDQRGDPDETV